MVDESVAYRQPTLTDLCKRSLWRFFHLTFAQALLRYNSALSASERTPVAKTVKYGRISMSFITTPSALYSGSANCCYYRSKLLTCRDKPKEAGDDDKFPHQGMKLDSNSLV